MCLPGGPSPRSAPPEPQMPSDGRRPNQGNRIIDASLHAAAEQRGDHLDGIGLAGGLGIWIRVVLAGGGRTRFIYGTHEQILLLVCAVEAYNDWNGFVYPISSSGV